MKVENYKFARLTAITLSFVCLLACSSQSDNKESKNKEKTAEVSVSKPKTSKALSELKPVSEDEKNSDIKIIPIGDPEKGILLRKDEEKKESDDETDD